MSMICYVLVFLCVRSPYAQNLNAFMNAINDLYEEKSGDMYVFSSHCTVYGNMLISEDL